MILHWLHWLHWLVVLMPAASAGASTGGNARNYTADWTSIDSRPLPSWYDDAKIGLFIHWGVFSVPSWGTSGGAAGEWYWWRLRGGQGYGPTGCGGRLGGPVGTCKPNPAYVDFHEKTFGADFKYSEFGPMFTAELFNPDAWAQLFAASGIKYVVLTSKHHEGWTNWCSKEAWNWNACDNGPRRDLVGELGQSVRAAGMHMGLYHSIFEFYHPLYLEDKANNFTTSRYVDEVYIPQSKELNQLYKPDLVWSDGDWEANSTYWKSTELLAWMYNEAPNRDTVVVNDRWGAECSLKHGGYYSGADRQQANSGLLKHKWENAFTLDTTTWGYKRNSNINEYMNMTSIMYEIVSTVAFGGNVLINVGPTHDGRIVPIFQERLLALGKWLKTSGESIYETRPWRAQKEPGCRLGTYLRIRVLNPSALHSVYYTEAKASFGKVYALLLDWPNDGKLELTLPDVTATPAVRLLGSSAEIKVAPRSGNVGITIVLPLNVEMEVLLQPAWAFELTGVQ